MVRVSLTEYPVLGRGKTRQRRNKGEPGEHRVRSLRKFAGRFSPDGLAPPWTSVPIDNHVFGGTPLPRILVVLIGGAATVVIVAGLKAIAWLLAPAFLALVLVITLNPVRTWLLGKGFPRWLTVTMLVAVVYTALLALFMVVVISVAQLGSLLPQYAERIDELARSATGTLGRFGVNAQQIRDMTSSVDTGKLVQLAGSVLASVGGLVTNLLFLMALLLFLSTESAWAGHRLGRVAQDRPWISAALRRFAAGTRTYLVVTTVFGGIVAMLDTAALAVIGVPGAVLWGLLSFVTNYIPNIGFVVGVAPPALIALLSGGWREMLIVLAVYGVLNFVVQSLIQPRFVAGSVGLSTLITVLALVFWTWLLGPLGAVLAVPATLLVKALLVDVDPRARWADALLSAPGRDRR